MQVDLVQFEAALHRGDGAAALARWCGPLADGLDFDDAPDFSHWLAQQRERARSGWRKALVAEAEASSERIGGAAAAASSGNSRASSS